MAGTNGFDLAISSSLTPRTDVLFVLSGGVLGLVVGIDVGFDVADDLRVNISSYVSLASDWSISSGCSDGLWTDSAFANLCILFPLPL